MPPPLEPIPPSQRDPRAKSPFTAPLRSIFPSASEVDQKAHCGRKAIRRKKSQGLAAGKASFLKRFVQDVLLPDPQVTWLPALYRAARRIVKERNIELVLITVPPFSSDALWSRSYAKSFRTWPSWSISATNGYPPQLIW